MVDAAKSWEQREDEPDRAYACFLVYLQLGPGRSIDKAYQAISKRSKGRSSTWLYYSSQYNWPDRAYAYDVAMLSQNGSQVVVNWVQTLVKLSEIAYEKVTSGNVEIRNLGQLLDVINTLGTLITPETVQAAREFAGGDLGRQVTEPEGTEEDI